MEGGKGECRFDAERERVMRGSKGNERVVHRHCSVAPTVFIHKKFVMYGKKRYKRHDEIETDSTRQAGYEATSTAARLR